MPARRLSRWISPPSTGGSGVQRTRPINAIESLTSKQRAYLRSLAHPLKPLIHVGKDGLTPSTIGAVEEALNTRELLKIRVLDAAPMSAEDAGRKLAAEVGRTTLVQVIGHTVVLYRPFSKDPVIRIPA